MSATLAVNVSVHNHESSKEKKAKKSSKAKGKEPATYDNVDVHKSEKQKKDKKRKSEEMENSRDTDTAEQLKREKKRLKKEKKARLEAERLEAEETAVTPGRADVEHEEHAFEKSSKRKREEKLNNTGVEVNTAEKKKKKKKREVTEDKSDTTDRDVLKTEESLSTEDTVSDEDAAAYLEKHSITIDFGKDSGELKRTLKPIASFSQVLPRIPSGLHSAFASFKEPTPIQSCTWPPLLAGRDVVGIAETGSGKTLAFGVPAVSKLVQSRGSEENSKLHKKSKGNKKVKSKVQVLAVAPTRELALQTHDTFSALGEPFGLASVAVFGGVDKEPQRRALQDVNAAMVVGTPGRILDLINEGACDLSGVTFLILDEADRMLDRGFENDIRTIIGHTAPAEQRQTVMFSATWPEAVRRLAASFQRNPVRVTVGSDDLTANSRVQQAVEVFDDVREKDSRLLRHMRELKVKKGDADESRILVFVLYKREAPRVEQLLSRQGLRVGGLHGDLSQAARMAALDDFKSGKTQVLVATDVAARGLDIANVGAVINYTFPLTIEDYIHRIGRTGRGGKTGKSITFFTGDNHERSLAGEYARVLREGGFDASALKKFPMTIKKKEHSVYGAFYRDDVPVNTAPTHMKF